MPLNRIAKIIKMWHKYGAWSNITFDALALSLFGSQICVDAKAKKTKISRKTTQFIQVQVEWAGTGKVLSHAFQLSRSEPIVRVGMLLGMLLLLQTHFTLHTCTGCFTDMEEENLLMWMVRESVVMC